MKTRILSFAFLLAALAPTFASAADPCDPVVRAQDSRMTCDLGTTRYEIVIETMMSKISDACPYDKVIEVSTAKIRVLDIAKDYRLGAEMTLLPETFDYRLGVMKGTFASPLLNLKLDGCTSPLNGGLTGGN